jgi:hypothetical protein
MKTLLAALLLALAGVPDNGHPWQYEVEPNDVYPTQLLPFAHTRLAGELAHDGDVDRYFMWLGFPFQHLSHWGGHLMLRKEPGKTLTANLWQGFPPPDSIRIHWTHATLTGPDVMPVPVQFIHVPWFPTTMIVLEVTGQAQKYSIWGPYYIHGPPEHIPGLPFFRLRMNSAPDLEKSPLPPL